MTGKVSSIGNLKIRKARNGLIISVNPKSYSLDMIFFIANNFVGKAYVNVRGDPNQEIIVCLKKKDKKTDLEKLGREFKTQITESNEKRELYRFIQNLGAVQERFSVLKNGKRILQPMKLP